MLFNLGHITPGEADLDMAAEAVSVDFMAAKIATAGFYTDHILPETGLQPFRAIAGL